MDDKAAHVGGVVGFSDPFSSLGLEDGVERPADLRANERRLASIPAPPLGGRLCRRLRCSSRAHEPNAAG
jgi:hypothetical protein